MDPQNTSADTESKVMFDHAKTLRLHTGNLVNRSRLKKKCPSSPSEEVRGRQAALMYSYVGTSSESAGGSALA